MDVLGFVQDLGPWTWVIAGVVLIILEGVAPGVFLVWFGIAALLTGLLDGALGLSWQAATLSFGALAVISVLVGRKLTGAGPQPDRSEKHLNEGAQALIGKAFTLDRAIVAGEGWIRINDTVWRVLGPDTPENTRVRVTGVEGTRLIVQVAEVL